MTSSDTEVSEEAKQSMTEAVHSKLKRGVAVIVKCPRCGYQPEPGKVLRVWDRVDVSADVTLGEKGELDDPHWEIGEGWDNKETVLCPKCDEESSMRKWGLKWNWEK